MEHKLGIIGYGYMGSWHHKNIKERLDGISVAAAYDIDPARRALAEENGLPFDPVPLTKPGETDVYYTL